MSDGFQTGGHSIGSRVRKALLWRVGSQFLAQLGSWGITIFVIRLLDPSDYGMAAMAQVFAAFFQLFAGNSFANALIQAKELSNRQTRQVFGLLIIINLSIAALQLITAPFVASYYREPMVAELLRVQAVIWLFMPFIAVATALCSRKMDFKAIASVGLWSTLLASGLQLILALNGFGVWSLVLSAIVQFGARALGLAVLVRWQLTPLFRFKGIAPLVRFGFALTLNGLLWFGYTRTDIIIAGRLLDSAEIGLYATAFFLASLPVSKLMPILNEIGFSAYSRVQDDLAEVRQGLFKAIRITLVLCCPMLIGLATVADSFVLVVLGERWSGASILLAYLCIPMPLYCTAMLISPAVSASGHPRIVSGNLLIALLVMAPAFLVGVYTAGVVGLCLAWLIGYPVVFSIGAWRSLRVLGANSFDLIKALMPSFFASGCMAGAVLLSEPLLPTLANPSLLALQIGTGALTYISTMLLFFRPVLEEMKGLLSRR